MIFACFVVVASMWITLLFFFRRLRRIELEMWGGKMDVEGLRAAIQRRKAKKAERIVKG